MAIYFGVAKGTYNSIKEDRDTCKKDQYAYIITTGLGNGTFHLQHAGWYNTNFPSDSLFEERKDAQGACDNIRRQVNESRRNCRAAYTKYKDRVFVHEFFHIHGCDFGVFLPTTNEIKQGVEYIKENSSKREDYAKWLEGNKDKSPKQIRQELIDTYIRRCNGILD